ncbi:MAG: ABC transporter ATP-binding protein, partial [Deltaproteobacteria bacterium]|nr:ABC transporter ATP-binding protein [Deltaproteobacteria bacterium]
MLRLVDISTEYDRVPMLRGVNLGIERGKLICLLGSNGAGKSTTVKTILGLVKPTGGEIRFEGRSLTGLKTNRIVELGISVVPEGRRLFPKMTVLENLRLGAFFVKDARSIEERVERVFNLFPALKTRLHQTAGTLSGGEQGMVAIGRGMMSRPKILLLDEPSLGLAPRLVQEYFQTISRINREEKTTILLIEQNAAKALSIADGGYVLQKGRIVAQGTARQLMETQ